MNRLSLTTVLAMCLSASACSPQSAPPTASASSFVVARPANLTPFGYSAKVNNHARFTLTKVEIVKSVGRDNSDRHSAAYGRLFVLVEYMVETPGIEAVLVEPTPDMFLVDQTGQMYHEDAPAGQAYVVEPDFQARYGSALEKPSQALNAAIFDVPASGFRRESWWAATGTDVKFALQ